VRLYLEYGEGSVQLPLGETIIGRDLDCSLRFNDPFVSRRHVRIRFGPEGTFVEELASRNGTRVNGVQVSGLQRLEDGDRLELGKRALTVVFVEQSPAPWAETTRPEVDELSAGVMDIEAAMRELEPTPKTLPAPPPERTCPVCRLQVPAVHDRCSACGYDFPPGRPLALTQKLGVEEIEAHGEDRRSGERFSLEVPIVYTSEALTIDATTQDLSPSGVFIPSPLLDEIGTRCHVTLLPEAAPAIPIGGVVARVVAHGQAGMGIEFRAPSERARRWLEAVLFRTS